MPKYQVLKTARDLKLPFQPIEITEIDGTYHTFVVRYSGDYVPHSHSADEFIYILEGGLELEIGNETVPLQQGEAMLIPAGITHRARCKNTALALVVETKRLQTEGTD